MSTDLESVLGMLVDQYEWVTLAILYASSIIEYVFPPFPGDTVTLAGAVLVTSMDWSFWKVFVAVTAGSSTGAMIDFYVGKRLVNLKKEKNSESAIRGKIDKLVKGFRRHGEIYLVLNRFLPGVRAFFFVAAGMAKMRPPFVLLYATVSAVVWNLLIMGVGLLVGANIESLERLFKQYTVVIWILLGAAGLYLLVRYVLVPWWRRRRGGDE